ncbi:MAG: DUF4330 family protein [Clostridia bacterium]|nr:DUF4330 family protein [Clostridia bacterium]
MAKIYSKKNGSGIGLNLIDFVVILLVLICLASAIIRIRRVDLFNQGDDLEQHEIYFSVTDISYTSEDALVIGDTFTLSDNKTVLGTLQSVDSVLPSTLYVSDIDGNVLSVNYPESTRIDVTGTVLSLGKMTDSGYLLGGTTYIAPGRAYTVQSEHMDFTLKILDIEEN